MISVGALAGLLLAGIFLTFSGMVLLTIAIALLNALLFIRQRFTDISSAYAEFLFVLDVSGGLVVCMWLVSLYKLLE